LTSSSYDKTINIFNVKDRKILLSLNGHKDKVNVSRFNNDSTWLISGSSDSCVKIWNIKNKECITG